MTNTQLVRNVEGEVALTALAHLKNGEITDAIACFGEKFQFKDRGLGLEFRNPRRLAEFFGKTRELYPDSSLQTDNITIARGQTTIEWTLRTTLNEAFYGGLSRKASVVLHGASIVRTENGRIIEWTDYYDGLTARRTSLAAYFEDWVEL